MKRDKTQKNNKGITLIALVITIIVLLILAGVSIAMLTGETGILTQAQRAKNETENAAQNEAAILDEYNQYLNDITKGETTGGGTTESTLGTVTGSETSNSIVQDSLGNKVVVPAGFVVQNPNDNVENGIVIVDVDESRPTVGSEFVWIPVGIIHTSSGDKTITLRRYVFNSDGSINEELSKTEPKDQLVTTSTSTDYFIESLKDEEVNNTQAKDIEAFIAKVNSTKGYYVGRYEARTNKTRESEEDGLTQVTVKPDEYVYNWITQDQAASLSQEMYNNINFESDLVNSYAWDTAMIFLQNCDNRDDKNIPYSQQTSLNKSLALQGTNNLATKDVICNIYDIASNCREWTTEGCRIGPCVSRGSDFVFTTSYTASSRRTDVNSVHYSNNFSFRPIIYL